MCDFRRALEDIEGHFLPGDHERITYSSDVRGLLVAIRGTVRDALAAGDPFEATLDQEGLVDCVARCLAKQDQKFIGGSDWAGAVGELYRLKAQTVLTTITKFKAGNRTGGL